MCYHGIGEWRYIVSYRNTSKGGRECAPTDGGPTGTGHRHMMRLAASSGCLAPLGRSARSGVAKPGSTSWPLRWLVPPSNTPCSTSVHGGGGVVRGASVTLAAGEWSLPWAGVARLVRTVNRMSKRRVQCRVLGGDSPDS